MGQNYVPKIYKRPPAVSLKEMAPGQLLRSAVAGRKKDASSKRNQKSFDFLVS